MSRREEILEAAKARLFPKFNEEFLKHLGQAEALTVNTACELAFSEGAKWADEHPSNATILKIIDLQLALEGKLLMTDEEPIKKIQEESKELTTEEMSELCDKYIVELIKEHWNDK